MIRSSLKTNFKLIRYHLITYIFKAICIGILFIPISHQLERYFKNRPIQEDMFSGDILNGLYEFFLYSFAPQTRGIFGFIGESVSLIVLFAFPMFLAFFVLDAFLDAGFISLFRKKAFFKGVKNHGWAFLRLRVFLFIPYLIVLYLTLLVTLYFYSAFDNIYLTTLAFICIGTLSLFFFKLSDHAKYNVCFKKKSPLLFAFKHLFYNGKKLILLQFIYAFCFGIGALLYIKLDHSFTVSNTFQAYLFLGITQCLLFLKQFLRYSYMDGVSSFLPLKKNVEQTNIPVLEKRAQT